MTPPTTDTSRDPEAHADSFDPSTGSYLVSWEKHQALLAERDALRDQLAAARNEALDVVLLKLRHIAKEHEEKREVESAIAVYDAGTDIRALKSTTPAQREITVQEAARVLLDHWYDNNGRTAQDLTSGLETWWRRGCNPETSIHHVLRAIAQDGQSDE
ncbi:hypothetical protein [Phaeobacter gallaeciensis]|uniref:hypothetical protein n=1 Tax=Phaeobacter gallaeciensis TaxID=60890 RepID=UPI00237FB125|nr:hypothetical protein [Phaeobacter gallaeciensis]MDE4189617.1 hypothetical protein [Phaeobacter gallaeciensis]MDE4198769.1 hypothetical protein [Phaeobacter gallaeciensis]MDE4202914.1 hypothetical protein [Phaeobacter gallaeciensis]MDE4207058.1 hypothetical protein [Phaeobacter gallaeciensis]MDE4215717.1 hypothetical protein [Phaeobacter gallaeciensis]